MMGVGREGKGGGEAVGESVARRGRWLSTSDFVVELG